MRVKAVYKNNAFKPLEKLDITDGEEVEISIMPLSVAKKFQSALKLQNRDLIEEIAQSDELF